MEWGWHSVGSLIPRGIRRVSVWGQRQQQYEIGTYRGHQSNTSMSGYNGDQALIVREGNFKHGKGEKKN